MIFTLTHSHATCEWIHETYEWWDVLAYISVKEGTLLHIFVQVQWGARESFSHHIHMQVHQKSFNESLRESMAERPNTPLIMLETFTWYKDNQGLYDYQANHNGLTCNRYEIKQSCKLYRHPRTNNIEIVDEDMDSPPMDYIYIASIVYDEEQKQYRVQSADVSGVQPHPYICQEQPEYYRNSHLVIADLQKEAGLEGYPLDVGNFVRLGKLEFEVIEVSDAHSTRRTKETSHLQKNNGVYEVEADWMAKGTCKFCLCEEATAKDPLIAPCNCRGSCAVVHVECLRSWINSKVRKEVSDQALSYNFSKFECEICGVLFPKAIRLPDRSEVTMLDYYKSTRPYVILESSTGKSDLAEQVVYVLFPTEEEPVKLGRGHNCAIRIQDITVSRVHAELRQSNGKFYIADMKSKFGTLVKFREEITLRDKLKLQSGRTLLAFSLFKCGNISAQPSCPKKSAQPLKKETLFARKTQKE